MNFATQAFWNRAIQFLIANAATVLIANSAISLGRAADVNQLSIGVIGAQEVRFDAKSGCNTDDFPDAPLRVFRRDDGQIIGIAAHFNNFPFEIKEGVFLRQCNSLFKGSQDGNESSFDDHGWITATWKDEKQRVIAIVHNEYWGQTHEGKCRFHEYLKCWSNALTLAQSSDDGQSFQLVENHVVAAGPLPLATTQGARYGYSNSSNVIQRGSYYYLAAEMIDLGGNHRGTCLMRAADVGIANSWRGWNGKGFYARLTGNFECVPLQNLSGVMGSIIRHGETYVAVTLSPTGATPAGVYYATSNDLIEWTTPRLLLAAVPSWSKRCVPGEQRINFPSLVDLSSRSPNFDGVGTRAELFFVAGESVQIGEYCKQANKKIMSMKVSISP